MAKQKQRTNKRPNNQGGHPKKEDAQVPPRPPTVPPLSQPNSCANKDNCDEPVKESKLQRASHYAAIFGAVVGLAGLWFLYDSIRVSRDGLTQTRRQFAAERRPFVMVQRQGIDVSGIKRVVFEPNERLYWTIFLNNFGDSPALSVFSRHKLVHGPGAMTRLDEWFSRLPQRLTRDLNTAGPSAVPPNVDDPSGYLTAISDAILNDVEFTYASTTDQGIVVGIRTEYTDSIGNFYRTDTCTYRLASGAIAFCDRHNELTEQLKTQ